MEPLTVDEAAIALRMQPQGVRRLIRDGRLRAVMVGRKYLIDRAEIDRVLTEGTGPVILAGGRVFRAPGQEGGAT